MKYFRSIFILLFIAITLLISGCESIYEISHPIEVKRKYEKAQQEDQQKRKEWLNNAEPQKKLSLAWLSWEPYIGTTVIKAGLQVKRLHIPSSYHENSTGGYLHYIAEYDSTNRQKDCDTATSTRMSDVFCSGEKQTFISKKEDGIFSRSYYSGCRSDVFKKTYMTNYRCSKRTSLPFDLEGIATCYDDKDHQGPYPTQHAADIANEAIDKAKKQDKINLVYYQRCFSEASGTYYVNYLAENTKKNEAQAKKIFDNIHFRPDKVNP